MTITRILKTLVICFSLSFGNLNAQDTTKGKLLIYIEPINTTIIRLDTTLIKSSQKPIELKPGNYVVKAWAPNKKLFIDTVNITAGKTVFITSPLKNSTEYSNYKSSLTRYKLKRVSTRILPALFTIGFSAYSYKTYTKNDKQMAEHLANAEEAQKNYNTTLSLANLDKYKAKYEAEKEAYDALRISNNKLAKTSSIVIPTAAIVSIGLFMLSTKFVKPTYTETTPLLSLNSINVNSDYHSTIAVAVVLNIKN